MTNDKLKNILNAIKDGSMDVDQGMEQLRDLPYQDIGHTKIDHHRSLRNGFPEVIYGAGKTPQQLVDIFEHMCGRSNILATRVSPESAEYVSSRFPQVEYNDTAGTLTCKSEEISYSSGMVGIITAGTSDLNVAEEAQVTCDMLGSRAEIISDIGVAGIHRLFDRIDAIRRFSVLIVVAGMEGALSSVIGGLVDQPIIAVPTSVGYGANFSGLSALLGMLTSCASGITVVNIDNGFGAACAACKINKAIDS
ncbi:nickel pincer cofactor biosynthesis protein LarB [Maridesulfovibrio sp.]|jgi:NCAIR mutase (PurE)-related protein|uniref:nickel pincer cofactor biosynthesis protein LarB n=1 Tax=Maridesulfovibrio sp. TaxID=2795000 RepID=UPI0029CA4329|nr:nickel pincer cofactor biosynthesis protein LarB [Maridesulfovibrio sp.]